MAVMMWPAAVLGLSLCHVVLGLVSVSVGLIASLEADLWISHSVSPVWSGVFFIVAGILGFFCAKRKTSYMIMCFMAFSIVSLVTAIVSTQQLRQGHIDVSTESHDVPTIRADFIVVGLVAAALEMVVCLLSTLVACRLAKAAKKQLQQEKNAVFQMESEDYRTTDMIEETGTTVVDKNPSDSGAPSNHFTDLCTTSQEDDKQPSDVTNSVGHAHVSVEFTHDSPARRLPDIDVPSIMRDPDAASVGLRMEPNVEHPK